MKSAIKRRNGSTQLNRIIPIALLSCASLSPLITTKVTAAEIEHFSTQLPMTIVPPRVTQPIPLNLPLPENIDPNKIDPNKIDQLKPKKTFPELSQAALEQARLESVSQDPINLITATLPIQTLQGNLAFNEVTVENGFRAIEREWLVMLNPAQLQQLKKLPIQILKQKNYTPLGLQLIQFKVPASLDSKTALSQMLPADIMRQLDRNHVYAAQTAATQTQTQINPSHSAQNSTSLRHHPIGETQAAKKTATCDNSFKIGMIDTDIETAHPALSQQKIISKNFVTDPVKRPKNHGTVVAGIFKAESDRVNGLLPNAELYAASAFYSRNDYNQGASLAYLIDALAWLSDTGVSVINMSLTGPHNQVLQQVTTALAKQGIIIVAAAGNQGPAAAPLYPAAYKTVIAVSAVDKNKQIYRWANQGEYIDFVGFGVRVSSLNASGGFSIESGTSLAAPIVSAKAACLLAQLKPSKALTVQSLLEQLKKLSKDLGKKGHDTVFGNGLIE
jgi:minor extracellular protease Epr